MLQRIFAVCAFTVGTLLAPAQPASADAKADVVAVLNQFTTALSASNAKSLVATCAPTAAIIDEFPPFLWHGKACAAWLSAFGALVKSQGWTNARITFRAADPVRVSGNSAYAVVPFRITWTDKNAPNWETGSGAFALQRSGGDWKIAAVGWSNNATGLGQ